MGKIGNQLRWMTEWGSNNPAQTCPLNDTIRAKVIQEERVAFEQFGCQG